jgi:hypothetical protein
MDYVTNLLSIVFVEIERLYNHGDIFFSFTGWLCGYSLKFDSKDAKLKANRLSLGFVGSDFVFHTNV